MVVENGRIAAIGAASRIGAAGADVVVDCLGTTVIPGLIDSHCHVVLGDYTPRQKTVDFLDSYVHGGITLGGLGGRGRARARPAARSGGGQGAGDRRREVLRALPPERDEGQRGLGGARARTDRRGLRRDGAARRSPRQVRLRRLRAAARRRAGGAPCPEARPLRHVPQRRHLDPGLEPDQPRGAAASPARRLRPRERRHDVARRGGDRPDHPRDDDGAADRAGR